MPVGTTYADWPFRPIRQRSVEENERWWQACFVRGQAEVWLGNETHWRIVAGGTGSGKSAAIYDLAHTERVGGRSLVVAYAPEQWPGASHALVPGGGHLAQLMAVTATAVRDHLIAHPELVERLAPDQGVFLRWLLEEFLGKRAFVRWRDSVTLPGVVEQLQSIPPVENKLYSL
jgi:hypothetical protein